MSSRKLTHLVWLTLTAGFAAGITSCSGNFEIGKTTPVTGAEPAAAGKETEKSSKTLTLEKQIISTFAAQQELKISSLDCPNDAPTKKDSMFECQATVEPGVFKVAVTMTDDQGGMNFSTKGLLMLPAVEKATDELVKKQTGEEVTTDCNSKTSNIRIIKEVGETFQCALSKGNTKVGVANVKVTSEDGKINIVTEGLAK